MQQMHQETVSRSGAGLELHQPKNMNGASALKSWVQARLN
jgi:hypothetical protein